MYRPSHRPSFRLRMFPSPFARLFGMVSAPFATNNTVTKGTKLPESRTVIRKLSFAPSEPRRLIFDYCGAIFALPEAFFFGYSGAIFERLRNPFLLTTTAQNMHVFLDGFFQLLLDFCLCFPQHILDDGLSGFGIVTDSVPALPSTVLTLSDVPLAVCSSLWHGISPFRNEQYRNQGNKATRKSNCYQKVIIYPIGAAPPYLCLLRRNFCAAGGVLLWLQRCDF